MKTGKMKLVMYCTALIMLLSVSVSAQFTPMHSVLPSVKKNGTTIEASLKAAVVQNTAEVSWRAVNQIKVRRYELEKSVDGENFFYVTAITAYTSTYAVQDRNFTTGTNYYRLKIVDNKGNNMYSEIISLDKKDKFEEIKIMPGVVTDELYIWIPANTQVNNVAVTDISGRKINRDFAIKNFTNAASVKLGRLHAGIYYINVATSTGTTTTLKFSKK